MGYNDRSSDSRGGSRFGGRDSGGSRGGFGGGGGFGGRGGSRGGFGGGGGFRDRPQMHQATCADCGNQCEVPFKPTGEKPVYCSNCFENSGRGMSRPGRDNDRGGDRDFGRKEFTPSKPFFEDKGKSNNDWKVEFEKLNAKLDRIMKVLAPSEAKMATEQVEAPKAKKAEEKKVEAKKPAAAAKPAAKAPAKKVVKKK